MPMALLFILMIQLQAMPTDSVGPVPSSDSVRANVEVVMSDSVEAALIELLRATTGTLTAAEPEQRSFGLSELLATLGGILTLLTAYFGARTAYFEFINKDPGRRDKAAKAATIFAIPLGVLIVLGLIAASVVAVSLLFPVGVVLIALAAWAYVVVLLDARYGFLEAYFPTVHLQDAGPSDEVQLAAARLSSLIPELLGAEDRHVTLVGDMGNGRRELRISLLTEVFSEPRFDFVEGAIEPINVLLELLPPPSPRIGAPLRVVRIFQRMALVGEHGEEKEERYYWPLTASAIIDSKLVAREP